MIKLDENSYMVGIWFASSTKTGNDWMAYLIADPENKGLFKIYMRTRYKKDEKIFDSKDEKSWMIATSKEGDDEEFMINMLDTMHQASRMAYDELDKIIIKGDVVKMMEMAKDKDWIHLKSEDIH